MIKGMKLFVHNALIYSRSFGKFFLPFFAVQFLLLPSAFAGLMEISGSINYKASRFDDANYQQSNSYTGSISYYFWDMSALELSYTDGLSELSAQATSDLQRIYKTQFQMTGLDLVISFASRKQPVQPYIKLGAAYLEKNLYLEVPSEGSRIKTGDQHGTVPSAGIGIKIRLSDTFSIKIGGETWSSPQNEDTTEPVTWDYAGRAGLSWFL